MEANMAIIDEINNQGTNQEVNPEVPIPTMGNMTILVSNDSGELKTTGGLIVPDHMKGELGKPQLPVIGKVLAIGTGCSNAASEFNKSPDRYEEATKVHLGDEVVINTNDPNKYTIVYPPEYNSGNIKYYFIIMHYSCINAILLSGRNNSNNDNNNRESN